MYISRIILDNYWFWCWCWVGLDVDLVDVGSIDDVDACYIYIYTHRWCFIIILEWYGMSIYIYIYIGMIMLCIHTYNQIHPYNQMSKSQEIRIARNDFCRSSVELGTFSGARMCPGTRAWVWTGTWTSFRGSCVEPWCHKTPARQTRGGSWGSGENGWKSWAGEVAVCYFVEKCVWSGSKRTWSAYLHLCILAEGFFQEATIGKATLMKGFIIWHWWRVQKRTDLKIIEKVMRMFICFLGYAGSMAPDFFVSRWK